LSAFVCAWGRTMSIYAAKRCLHRGTPVVYGYTEMCGGNSAGSECRICTPQNQQRPRWFRKAHGVSGRSLPAARRRIGIHPSSLGSPACGAIARRTCARTPLPVRRYARSFWRFCLSLLDCDWKATGSLVPNGECQAPSSSDQCLSFQQQPVAAQMFHREKTVLIAQNAPIWFGIHS
jgi:hypothetical protein